MSMTAKQRQTLLGASHHLKPVATIVASSLTGAVVAQVRSAFTRHELIKIRVRGDTAAECDVTAAELARDLPCELVRRVGRVVVLYREKTAPSGTATSERRDRRPGAADH